MDWWIYIDCAALFVSAVALVIASWPCGESESTTNLFKLNLQHMEASDEEIDELKEQVEALQHNGKVDAKAIEELKRQVAELKDFTLPMEIRGIGPGLECGTIDTCSVAELPDGYPIEVDRIRQFEGQL